MTLFFPYSTDPVKVNSSNSQVGVSVGDTMNIAAGDTFTIGVGSTSSITIGPSASFNLGAALDVNLSSTTSYSYGFDAEFGNTTTATTVTSNETCLDSYEISAGTYTNSQKQARSAEHQRVYLVLIGTIVSMGVIATGVVAGLSSPMFITDPSNTPAAIGTNPNGKPILTPAKTNPNAVVNHAGMLQTTLVLAVTTTVVFIAQWVASYMLTKSSKFSLVTNLLFNSTGITASAQTEEAYNANQDAAKYYIANPDPLKPPSPPKHVQSVETIMFTPATSDAATLTHRVSQAPEKESGKSAQFSEVVLRKSDIQLNSITQPKGGSLTHSTEVILNSADKTISLLADSVKSSPAAATSNGGSITIGKDTNIINPDGITTLTNKSKSSSNTATVILNPALSATLSCSNGEQIGTGSVVATPIDVTIGMSLNGGNAIFNENGVTINGANLNLGGVLTILGSQGTSSKLADVMSQIETSNSNQQRLQNTISTLQAEMASLKALMNSEKIAAESETEALKKDADSQSAQKPTS